MESPNAPFAASSGGSQHKQVLAMDPALGAVFICDRCEHIHFQLGDLHVRTDLEGFQAVVVLLNRAAANYELWAEHLGSAA